MISSHSIDVELSIHIGDKGKENEDFKFSTKLSQFIVFSLFREPFFHHTEPCCCPDPLIAKKML